MHVYNCACVYTHAHTHSDVYLVYIYNYTCTLISNQDMLNINCDIYS